MSEKTVRNLVKTLNRPGGGELKDISEIAAALGEAERTITSWTQSGVIPSLRIGYRTVRYRL